MAKQTIDIGTTANDGTGDPIRTAFDKVNDNFTELYTDDAGDVGSITATAPIERDSATGAVTISLADNGVSLAKMAGIVRGKFIYGDASGDPAYLAAGANGKLLVADANGDPSWTSVSGDATLSAGALTIADDAVDADKLANSINTEIAANTAKVTNATHTGDVTGATALTIANDAVEHVMLENRYTAKATSTGTGSQNLDASTATSFLLTGNVATATLTIQNMKLGQVIDIQMTGTLSSAAITLATDFSSTTFYKVGATDFDTAEKNVIQVVCIDDTDAAAIINYSVGKLTADTTP